MPSVTTGSKTPSVKFAPSMYSVVLAAPTDVSPEGSVPGSGRPYAIWLTGETVTISDLTVATADGTAAWSRPLGPR